MSPQDLSLSPSSPTIAPPVAEVMADIVCPACGTNNTPDSKFCRQCGQLLRPSASVSKNAASVDANEEDALTSPQEIDARRARQLLDRAMQLAERGQLPAAILACRQAATLDSATPAPFSMLGSLLERSGDVRGAVAAYERVLLLSPDNSLESESLSRLRDRLDRAPAFHFNPDELFSDDADLPSFALPDTAPSAAAPTETSRDGGPTSTPLLEPKNEEAPLETQDEEDFGVVSPSIEARLPPTSAELVALESPSGEGAPTATVPVGEGALNIEAYAPPTLSAYTPPLETPSAPVEIPAPNIEAAESDALMPPLDNTTRVLGEGAGKPAVSGLATAIDERTLADVAVLVAPVTPSTVELPARATLSPDAMPARPRSVPNVSPAPERRKRERRQVNLPVAVERRRGNRRSPMRVTIAPPTNGVPATGIAPMNFEFSDAAPTRVPLWTHLLRGPSFFARTLPLVAVGAFSLGFLSWARSQAVSRDEARAASGTVVVAPNSTNVVVATPTPALASPPVAGAVANPAGVPISNAPATPAPSVAVAPAAPPVANRNPAPVAAPAPRATARAVVVNRPRSSPNFPLVPIPPAPVPPAPSSGRTTSGGNIILPPPRVDVPSPAAPPIQVGSALSPGGGPRPDTIRITQGTIVRSLAPPPRTGTAARSDERDAAQAARAGQSDRAINGLTDAINATGSDAGYLYQQRAQVFLQRGDVTRAIADFQSAISAYNDQINRGVDVAAAQAGLRAARSGLAVAQNR